MGWYFMHLKFEKHWVYFMLVPAGILACVLIFALIPDIANPAIDDETGINDDDTAAISAATRPHGRPDLTPCVVAYFRGCLQADDGARG